MFQHASKMDTSKRKIRRILIFFFNEVVNSSQLKIWIVFMVLRSNFGFVDSVSVTLISKMHRVLDDKLTEIPKNYANRWVRPSCKHGFDCAKAKNAIKAIVCKKSTVQKWPALANRRKIGFHQKLFELSLDILIHPLYCLDLASSDFYQFLYVTNVFDGEKFASKVACQNLFANTENAMRVAFRNYQNPTSYRTKQE